MTEEEAKTKWCPHAKGQYLSETHCKTSDCMMWEAEPKMQFNVKRGKCGLVTKKYN